MPTPVVQKITAWSFSRWKDYEQCPRRAKYKHIDKKKEPGSAAMQRGGDIDKKAEQYLKGEIKALPSELLSFKKEFAALKKLKPLTQENWAMTVKWVQCDWFHKEAWLRVKMDAAYLLGKVLNVIDFKTGKPKDDHPLQLSLYAIAGFTLFPQATEVHANLWYTDQGTEDPAKYKVSELPKLKKDWLARINPMMNDSRFAPKPGNYCTWCPFSKGKGGPCEY